MIFISDNKRPGHDLYEVCLSLYKLGSCVWCVADNWWVIIASNEVEGDTSHR